MIRSAIFASPVSSNLVFTWISPSAYLIWSINISDQGFRLLQLLLQQVNLLVILTGVKRFIITPVPFGNIQLPVLHFLLFSVVDRNGQVQAHTGTEIFISLVGKRRQITTVCINIDFGFITVINQGAVMNRAGDCRWYISGRKQNDQGPAGEAMAKEGSSRLTAAVSTIPAR